MSLHYLTVSTDNVTRCGHFFKVFNCFWSVVDFSKPNRMCCFDPYNIVKFQSLDTAAHQEIQQSPKLCQFRDRFFSVYTLDTRVLVEFSARAHILQVRVA